MKKGKPLYCFFLSGMEMISLLELLVAGTTAGTTAAEPHYFSLWCRWERGRLRWWLQRVHRRDVWRAAERFPAPPHRHAQWPRRVRRQPRLLPAQSQSHLAPAAEHVPLPGWDVCLMLVLFCFCFCFSCCPRFGWRMWGVWGLTACGTCSSVIVGDDGLPNAEAVGWVSEPQRMRYKRFIHCHDSFCTVCWWICRFMLCVYLFGVLGRRQCTLFSSLSMLDFRHPDGHSHTQRQSPQLEHRWTRLEAAGRHAPLHIRSHRNGQGLRTRSAFVFFSWGLLVGAI